MKTSTLLLLPEKFVKEDVYARRDGEEFSTLLSSSGADGARNT